MPKANAGLGLRYSAFAVLYRSATGVLLPLSLICLAAMLGCTPRPADEATARGRLAVAYAQGFAIDTAEHGYTLTVHNPWPGAEGIQHRLWLHGAGPAGPPKGESPAVRIPARRVVCLSTTHVAFLERLGLASRIVGIAGANLVTSQAVRSAVDSGLVVDVGPSHLLSYELILQLQPDLVLAYGVGGETVESIGKLRNLGIPVIPVAEYLEECPLGRAEWIRAIGLLMGHAGRADSIFNSIAAQYHRVASLAASLATRPAVFLNLPWKGTWYLPRGEGYMARLIADAAGSYLLAGTQGSGSLPYSLEAALALGAQADVWLNTGTARSIAEILSECPQARIIPALRQGRVFNNNNRLGPGGGNDFWESGVVNPHLILKDLVSILHPGLIAHELVYYRPME